MGSNLGREDCFDLLEVKVEKLGKKEYVFCYRYEDEKKDFDLEESKKKWRVRIERLKKMVF